MSEELTTKYDRVSHLLLRQKVGYLIDSARRTGSGEYILPAKVIDDLKVSLSDKVVIRGMT